MLCLSRPCTDSQLQALWEPALYFTGFYSYQVAPSCHSGVCRDGTRCQPVDQQASHPDLEWLIRAGLITSREVQGQEEGLRDHQEVEEFMWNACPNWM